MNTYSFSRLQTFENCMRAGYYKYKERRPSPSGTPALVGKVFHLAIHYVIGFGIDSLSAVKASTEKYGIPESETIESLTQMVEQAYLRINNLAGEYAELISEYEVNIEIAPGISVRAFIDVILDDPSQDLLGIIDFKTSWVSYSADKTHQLRLYALLLLIMRTYTPTTVKGMFLFPRLFQEDSEIFISKEMLLETKEWALNLIHNIELAGDDIKNHPMTTNHRNCELCPYVQLCASGYVNDLPAAGTPADHIEAEKIGEYLFLQELALKQMKEGLKKYVMENEPVATQHGIWTYRISDPAPKIDLESLYLYAGHHNKSVEEILQVDTKKLKVWIDEDETGELNQYINYSKPRLSFGFEMHPNEFYED